MKLQNVHWINALVIIYPQKNNKKYHIYMGHPVEWFVTQIFLSHFFWYHEICSVSEIKYHLVEQSAIKSKEMHYFCKNWLLFFKIFFGAVKVKTFWKFLLNNQDPMPILFSWNRSYKRSATNPNFITKGEGDGYN